MEPEKQNQPPTKVTKTWFMQRGNNPDDIIACSEQEAWGILRNKSNWARNDFKIIGVSSGELYVKTINEGKAEIYSIQAEVSELSRDLTRYLNTYDKFKFEELLPDTDPKVIKVKSLIKEIEVKLAEKNAVLANANRYVVDKAFKAELEKARGNIEMPQNFDVFTPNGDRNKILKALGQ